MLAGSATSSLSSLLATPARCHTDGCGVYLVCFGRLGRRRQRITYPLVVILVVFFCCVLLYPSHVGHSDRLPAWLVGLSFAYIGFNSALLLAIVPPLPLLRVFAILGGVCC